jgi:16S rRNA (adenine1518-N6/adenine1519-N6)-dimethyltransferase
VTSPKARLRALGVRPKKRLSQAFMEEPRVAAAIVRAARLEANSEVLEVGPGLGVLTRLLARRARRVVAVELDTALADALRQAEPGVDVINLDILQFDPSEHFVGPYTVVANLPYHITSPALRHLLGSGPPFAARLVVMVQAEVADRIAAEPGEMSALAVAIQVQAQVRVVRRVGKEAFYPQPRVDSAVLVLEPRHETAVGREELENFIRLVQAGFKQPRKTLANSLADGLGVPKLEASELLARANLDSSVRPQVLSVDDWVRLFRAH